MMENEFQFQQPLAVASIENAYFSGVCDGLSYRSLLTGDSLELPVAETRNPVLKSALFSTDDGAAPLYNFFSETAPSSLHQYQLPSVLSLKQPQIQNRKQPRPRRSKLSDQTYRLRELLPVPVDEKMDMATVLEEAYNYIKFLQAQVSVLQSMPLQSAASAAGNAMTNLNRQQVLQMVTNSPAVQTQLCVQGCCVYAGDQMVYDSYNPNLFRV